MAESHVFTSDVDFKIRLSYSDFSKLSLNYPKKFVRFVYCIGYSESRLFANRPLNPNFRNPGTWQYWKLFCACTSDSPKIRYCPVFKGSTKNLKDRVNNKIDLLERLRKKGIWLVDSGIVGINNLPRKQREEIIAISWNNYVKSLIKKSNPRYVICIGKTAWDVLEDKFKQIGIRDYNYVYQPQAHLASAKREKEHKKLQRICSSCGLFWNIC